MAANNLPAIFDRLVGLETEYAIRFHRPDSALPLRRRSKFQLYRSLVSALQLRVPLVRAKHFKEGVFTANGGAVWFETERLASGGGLVEGSTPECRGARQMLLYQRAQDRVLAEAAGSSVFDGQFTLIKNCRDAHDNVYGAQENYEATIARGLRLAVWRIGLVLLLPAVAVTWFSLVLMIAGVIVYLAVAGILYLPLRLVVPDHRELAIALFGRDLATGSETGSPLPGWLESVMLWTARITSAPLALLLILLARISAFVSQRRRLTPFLVTRTVFAGAGMIDRAGKFHLADKAPAVNCVVGFGGFIWDRPIYNFGHFFKAASIESLLLPADYFRLFGRRQRLQIGLGDSNMAEVAEYLRIGTTLLVLDAIEAGYLDDAPQVKRPIRTMHRIVADPTLQSMVQLKGRGELTAIELQRFYCDRCRRFLDDRLDAPGEAFEVLRMWQQTLDDLEHDPAALVGQIDWVTKKYLLDDAGDGASWEARKKIDIRYHELSPEGYFERLKATELVHTLVDTDEVQRAIRTAPPNSPATTRGHYIREFASGDEPLSVNWRRVVIGRGRRAKVVTLDRYGQTRDRDRRDDTTASPAE